MHFSRKTLLGGDIEFFNGSIWKPISQYKKDEKVLIYYEDGTVALSTPLEYIKINKTNINHVTSTMFKADINDDALFYGIRRYEKISSDEDTVKMCTFKDAYLGDFNYFTHYELISTFQNIDTISKSMLSEDKIKIMIYAITLGKIKNNNCKIKLENREIGSKIVTLLSKNSVKYNYNIKELVLDFRLPRGIDVFIHNPLIYSQREVMMMIHLIIDILGDKSLKPISKEYLDFIQFIFALGGKRVNVVGDRLRMFVGRYTRLQAPSFKIEEKKVNMQYSFTVRSGLIVLRSNGLIFVLSDYKK